MKRDLIKECLPEEDYFMAPAWLALIRYAAGEEFIQKWFKEDTGLELRFPGGIEGQIDEATGFREELLFVFAKWVTDNLWGTRRGKVCPVKVKKKKIKKK